VSAAREEEGLVNTSPIELSLSGPVAELRISGAVDLDWTRSLQRHAAAIAARDDIRVVRVRAEGRFFCPGGDLKWMAEQSDRRAAVRELADTLHAGLLELSALDAPVVAEVQGVTAGAGVSLVLGADIAVAATSATFTLAYAGVGLSPDGGCSWLLPRIVGRRRALEIMLLNPRLDAQQAEQQGIVTRVVPDEALAETVDGIVAQLAAGPTAAYGAAQRLVMRSATSSFAEQLDAEAAEISELAGGATGTEGIHAFLEKRAAAF
jgi:2-(1,2-epoxy-1,2-dihydrophenyl)acetyl-CoA isomerase